MIYFNHNTDQGLQAQLDKAAQPATQADHAALVKAVEEAVADARRAKEQHNENPTTGSA
jgi:hypothetical protein